MKTHIVVGGYLIHRGKVLLIHHKKLGMWLPVGGHIEKDETPDDAICREFKEEVNLEIEILNHSRIRNAGRVKRRLALPIDVHVHSVGDHNHCCLFYLCGAKDIRKLKINKNEVNAYEWFTKQQLKNRKIPGDVRNIALEAFRILSGKK